MQDNDRQHYELTDAPWVAFVPTSTDLPATNAGDHSAVEVNP